MITEDYFNPGKYNAMNQSNKLNNTT